MSVRIVVPSKPVIFVNGAELESMRVTGSPSIKSLGGRRKSLSSTIEEKKVIQDESDVKMMIDTDDVDEDDNDDTIVTVGPFDENSVVVLECNSINGRPLPQVAWFNGSQLMSSKTVITSDNSEQARVTAAVSFILTRSDLTSRFSCHVWNNATLNRPIIQSIAFDVHGKIVFTDFCAFLSFFVSSPLSPLPPASLPLRTSII